MPEMACLLLIHHLRIRNGRVADRTPVDDAASLIDPALFMHLAEHFRHGPVAALVHGKALPFPVAGGAQLFQLSDNPSAVFLFPFPGSLKEAVSSQILLAYSLFLQLLNDLYLRGDAGMVCSRLPQSIIALHPLITDQDVLHGIVQGMTHMKLARDIRRRDHYGKGCLRVIHLGVKILLIHPFLIQSVLNPLGVIGFSKLSAHVVLLSRLRIKRTLCKLKSAKGVVTRYHLFLSLCGSQHHWPVSLYPVTGINREGLRTARSS